MNSELKTELLAAISAVLTSHGYIPIAKLEAHADSQGGMTVAFRTATESSAKRRVAHYGVILENEHWRSHHPFFHKGQKLTLVDFDIRDRGREWKCSNGLGIVELSSADLHIAVDAFARSGRPAQDPKPRKRKAASAPAETPKPAVDYSTWG